MTSCGILGITTVLAFAGVWVEGGTGIGVGGFVSETFAFETFEPIEGVVGGWDW